MPMLVSMHVEARAGREASSFSACYPFCCLETAVSLTELDVLIWARLAHLCSLLLGIWEHPAMPSFFFFLNMHAVDLNSGPQA